MIGLLQAAEGGMVWDRDCDLESNLLSNSHLCELEVAGAGSGNENI